MRVLTIGTHDPSVFDEQSELRRRTEAYARAFGHLALIDTTTRRAAFPPFHAGRFSVYGTNSWSRLFSFFDAARLASRLGGDVVTTQDPFENGLAGALAAQTLRIPLHVQLHTDPFTPAFARASFLNRLRLLVMPLVIRRAARIRVVSDRLKREIEKRYRPFAPVTVLPIYTDLTRFRAVERAPEKGSLLWVGRFEKEKDPMLAIKALATARAADIDARLVMLGEGRLKQTVAARAKARALAPYLALPGHVDPLPFLARAELMLATSRYEGYGLAVVEALAAGCPVFATDVGVAREAGAAIASSRANYSKEAAELLAKGPLAPPPIPDQYPSFAAYVERYAADIRETAR